MTPISPVEATLALSQQVEKLKAQLAAAQQQAAESAALAERMREHLHLMVNMRDKLQMQAPSRTDEELFLYGTTIWQTARELSCYPPFNCLAQYRDGVLEEVATKTEGVSCEYGKDSQDPAGGLFSNAIASELSTLAAEIRAMKGKA